MAQLVSTEQLIVIGPVVHSELVVQLVAPSVTVWQPVGPAERKEVSTTLGYSLVAARPSHHP